MDKKQLLFLCFLFSMLLQPALAALSDGEQHFSSESENDTGAGEAAAVERISPRPVVDLEQLRILELDRQGVNWRQDWWKYLLMLLAGLLCLCLVVYLTRVLFWLFGVVICLGSGLAGGLFLKGLFTPWLPALLPEQVTSLVSAALICHILAGLLGYGAAACLLAILFRPLKQKRKND